MRLNKVRLSGFKSFVDPTSVQLPGNLTGVVGPNGCGKSNIIDAVRWVMGELSARHLRGDSMPAARVRACVPTGFLLGRSVHTVGEGIAMASAGGLDYLLFGTVFESGSKPGIVPSGVVPLARLAAAVRLPVLAIGGMTLDRAGEVARAGAAGIAAISLFDTADPSAIVPAVARAFDTA